MLESKFYMRQLPLEISPPAAPAFENFVAGANGEALAAVRELAAGALRESIVYLWGERGSGRTHLLRAAARANPALVLADDVERSTPRRSRRCSTRSMPRATARPPVLAAGRAAAGLACGRTCAPARVGPGLPAARARRRGEGRHLQRRGRAPRAAPAEEVLAYLLTRCRATWRA
jgi:hypothetical protein